MKTEILAKLKQSQDYVSGQELCTQLNVTRTAVWKVINQLRDEGYIIEAVKNKGYKIAQSPDILSKSEIESSLLEGYSVEYLDETDSTNNHAKLIAEKGAANKTLVVSDAQSAGKGRRGRSFDSPKGVSIFMSLLLRPDIIPNKASMITIVAAMAVREGIEKATGLLCSIKWPNDIICNGKKVCGILTEMSCEMQSVNYVVVGIGINVNNVVFPKEIENIATSIKLETKENSCRSQIISEVIKGFEKYYDLFLKSQDMSMLKEEYNKYLVNVDNKVRVIGTNGDYEAIAKGIDDDGELIVNKDGKLTKVLSGEVSVRGVYGYV